jgi:hypothetical protein
VISPHPYIWIDYSRSGNRVLFLGLPLFGGLSLLLVWATLFPDKGLTGVDPATGRVMSGLCAAGSIAVVLMLLATILRMKRKPGLLIDARGVTWRMAAPEGSGDGDTALGDTAVTDTPVTDTPVTDNPVTVGWHEVVAVGIGYKRPPLSLAPLAQGYMLEFYPANPMLDGRLPQLHRVEEAPPRPDLPPMRYRMLLPPLANVPAEVGRAVQTFAPHLWIGIYQREWHRLPAA